MTLGAEYENKELIAGGYRIAKAAMREDLEGYDYTSSYSQVIQALYDVYKDDEIKERLAQSKAQRQEAAARL